VVTVSFSLKILFIASSGKPISVSFIQISQWFAFSFAPIVIVPFSGVNFGALLVRFLIIILI
tara:strand:+ start:59 stop:244 length:186 start_codon:yes stop_codon:yes gene_type:complete